MARLFVECLGPPVEADWHFMDLLLIGSNL